MLNGGNFYNNLKLNRWCFDQFCSVCIFTSLLPLILLFLCFLLLIHSFELFLKVNLLFSVNYFNVNPLI